MKCQILFSRKIKKNLISLSFAEFADSMVSFKYCLLVLSKFVIFCCCYFSVKKY